MPREVILGFEGISLIIIANKSYHRRENYQIYFSLSTTICAYFAYFLVPILCIIFLINLHLAFVIQIY